MKRLPIALMIVVTTVRAQWTLTNLPNGIDDATFAFTRSGKNLGPMWSILSGLGLRAGCIYVDLLPVPMPQ